MDNERLNITPAKAARSEVANVDACGPSVEERRRIALEGDTHGKNKWANSVYRAGHDLHVHACSSIVNVALPVMQKAHCRKPERYPVGLYGLSCGHLCLDAYLWAPGRYVRQSLALPSGRGALCYRLAFVRPFACICDAVGFALRAGHRSCGGYGK